MKNEKKLTVKFYVGIFAWLVGITVLEVGSVAMELPKHALVIFILGTAIAKALLIAVYFMHMRFERALIWYLPGVPVVLALFFVFMLFPDMVYHLTHYFSSGP